MQTERNYAQIEKEALALIFGVKNFHQYLYGRKCTLVTDHKPLLAILGPKKGISSLVAARMQCWAVLLSAYCYEIEFKSTYDHGNADGLSCLPLKDEESANQTPETSIFNICQIQSLPVTSQEVEIVTRNDPVLSKVYLFTRKGWPKEVAKVFRPYQSRDKELTVEAGCVLWGMCVIIPQKLQGRMLEELHRDHPGVSRMKSLARSHMYGIPYKTK